MNQFGQSVFGVSSPAILVSSPGWIWERILGAGLCQRHATPRYGTVNEQ
jgi:hypothetical protein